MDIQRVAKCIIGQDYPMPIVNHVRASRINMDRMRQAYQHLSKYRNTSGRCALRWLHFLSTVLLYQFFYVGDLLSMNENIPVVQQFRKDYPHVSQLTNTILPTTTTMLSVKDVQRPSSLSYSSYNRNQLQQYKSSELFAKNLNYDNSGNSLVLAYSHRYSQLDDKFENCNFSANSMNVDGPNYFDSDQKEFRAYKHRHHELDQNFDSFMETDNENSPSNK